jgi:DNA-binding CsgD family transcriptional regulator
MSDRGGLTKQESHVLAFVVQGWRTARIAQELFISPRTVETHLAHIFAKLGVSSRTQAAIYAIEADLLESVEIRTNPEDMLDNYQYPKYNESNNSNRTHIRKELA